MKRALIAVATSIVCVIFYYFVVYVVSPFILGTPPLSPNAALLAPISLPSMIYQGTAPGFVQNFLAQTPGGGMFEGLIFLIANVVLFAIPIYLLMAVSAKRD